MAASSASTSGASPTASGTRRRADTWLRLATWRSTVSCWALTHRPPTWRLSTDDAPGQSGPDVVNGDGDRAGFSVVETGIRQLQVDVGQDDFTLAGLREPALVPAKER